MSEPTYLGDSVYAEIDGLNGSLKLMTLNGYPDDPRNLIYLDDEGLRSLILFLQKHDYRVEITAAKIPEPIDLSTLPVSRTITDEMPETPEAIGLRRYFVVRKDYGTLPSATFAEIDPKYQGMVEKLQIDEQYLSADYSYTVVRLPDVEVELTDGTSRLYACLVTKNSDLESSLRELLAVCEKYLGPMICGGEMTRARKLL